MNTWKKLRRLLPLATAAAALSLNACGTVEGFGNDLQKLGRSIENKADDVSSGREDRGTNRY